MSKCTQTWKYEGDGIEPDTFLHVRHESQHHTTLSFPISSNSTTTICASIQSPFYLLVFLYQWQLLVFLRGSAITENSVVMADRGRMMDGDNTHLPNILFHLLACPWGQEPLIELRVTVLRGASADSYSEPDRPHTLLLTPLMSQLIVGQITLGTERSAVPVLATGGSTWAGHISKLWRAFFILFWTNLLFDYILSCISLCTCKRFTTAMSSLTLGKELLSVELRNVVLSPGCRLVGIVLQKQTSKKELNLNVKSMSKFKKHLNVNF